jgi:hypothetical protein
MLFSKEKMKKNYRPDFLIIGMERSGTHWVAALLNAHPNIACFPSLPWRGNEGGNTIGEVHFFDTIASLYPEENYLFTRSVEDFSFKYNKVFADLLPLQDSLPREEFVEKLKERYSTCCNEQRGNKRIVGESTPAYVFHLSLIDSLYPSIKKLCIIRDPKDKIVSWYFNKEFRKGTAEKPNITVDFAMSYLHERIIPEYEALQRYAKDIHCLTYEALAKNTKSEIQRMTDYLDIETDDNTAQVMAKDASFKNQTKRDSGGKGREKGQTDPSSGLRKGVSGDWENYIERPLAKKVDQAVSSLREQVFKKYHVTA